MTTATKPPICDYEGSDYQESFWDSGKRAYEDRVEAIALQRLLPDGGELLLEIGAGAGRNTLRYRGFNRIVLLDYSVSQLQLAQERLGRSDRYIYVAGDAYNLPFVNGLFNGATMIRTLHHLKEAPLALQEARRVLKQEGIFILEYANKQNLKSIIRYGLGKQSWSPFSEEPIEFAPLNFDFHPRAIHKWLQDCNFLVQKQLTVSHFRINFLKRIIPLQVLVWVDSLAQWTGDWWQLSPSVFLRSKAIGMQISENVQGFFACPNCHGYHFMEQDSGLICQDCHQIWEVRDGIYIFK
ncbi:MAG: methyltransferase domain-containing protein [Anaerolineales bacterium]